MSDYISREAFKQEVRKLSTHYLNEWDTLGVLAAVDRIPAADVRPVVRGKWINPSHDSEMCSACGTMFYISALFSVGGNGEPNFCPNCGAMMEES